MKIIYLSIIVIAIIIVLVPINTTFAQNQTNSTDSVPINSIKTQYGGWITPMQTTTQNGSNLTINYETGIPSTNKYANPGPPPSIDMTLQTNHQVYTRDNTIIISGKEDPTLLQKYGNNITISIYNTQTKASWCCYNFTSDPDGSFFDYFTMPTVFSSSGYYNMRASPSSSNSTVEYGVGFQYYAILPLPLEQLRVGIMPEDISCNNGLFLAITQDKKPTCIGAETISKLASRGFFYGISANETQVNYTTILIPPGSEDQSSNKTYSPDVTTVVLGINNTVRWTNQAESANSIAADISFEQDVKKFGSDGIIKPGQSYEFTFTKPGTFSYHGEPHPWQMGKIIVLPNRSDIEIPTKTSVTNHVHYYDSSNLHPQVVLYDYFYNGIDKGGIVTINNQTFYQTTLGYDIYQLPKGIPIQFHNVTFSFPEGTLTTPGGAFVNLDVKFQDGNDEVYGGTKTNPDGSGMSGGISIPTEYGPHLATNSTTILGNHTLPQAGITIYNDKIKLLVSTRNQTIQTGQIIPSCVSKIPHQYALAGFRGDTLCPVMNFQASGNVVNYTGFYGVYGYTAYPGTSNFVLEPGHNGTITYQIAIDKTYSFDNNPPSNEVNITNDIEFMHDAGMHDHPGVDVSSNQQSEIIQKNSSAFINITFTASKDARPGTYWVDLPPNFCAGGEVIILTITDCGK